MSKTFTLKKGFTLLELLVVISIMGILMTLGMVAFSTAQKKGRDAKRTGDIKAMQNAFEQYYADPVNMSKYGTCDEMSAAPYFANGARPKDPKTGADYDCFVSPAAYCICAKLDDTTGGNAGVSSGVNCAYGAGGGYYCLSNLQ